MCGKWEDIIAFPRTGPLHTCVDICAHKLPLAVMPCTSQVQLLRSRHYQSILWLESVVFFRAVHSVGSTDGDTYVYTAVLGPDNLCPTFSASPPPLKAPGCHQFSYYSITVLFPGYTIPLESNSGGGGLLG